MHIIGPQGEYVFQERKNYNPAGSITFVSSVPVAEIPDTIGMDSIRSVISTTAVKNDATNTNWNCQHWVAEALSRLVTYGYLAPSQREAAVSRMMDLILDAKDDYRLTIQTCFNDSSDRLISLVRPSYLVVVSSRLRDASQEGHAYVFRLVFRREYYR